VTKGEVKKENPSSQKADKQRFPVGWGRGGRVGGRKKPKST